MGRRFHTPPTRIVAEIPRGTGEVLRVAILGRPASHVDLRSFCAHRRSQGEPRPSREVGVTLRLDQVSSLIEALAKAKEEAR